MTNDTTEPESTKEKEKELKIRDLKPKDDVKGGAPAGKKEDKEDKAAPRRTGEIDFMKYMKDAK